MSAKRNRFGKIKDPSLKKEWLKDLESGRFRQTDGMLCAMGGRGGHASYCCLGVMGCTLQRTNLIAVTRPKSKHDPQRGIFFDGEENFELLPENLRKKIGLTKTGQKKLALMNDNGKSFKEIANWIRTNL